VGKPCLRGELRAAWRPSLCRMVGGLPACRSGPVRRRRIGACELGDRHPTTARRDSCPTLVLSRRGDPIGPPDAARYMAEADPRRALRRTGGRRPHPLARRRRGALRGESSSSSPASGPRGPSPVRSRRSCSVTSRVDAPRQRARRASPESSAMRAGPTCSAVTVASPTSRLPPEQGGSSTAPATG